ncbi:MAG: thiamine phosphate synthase [Terriglobia bacterium]
MHSLFRLCYITDGEVLSERSLDSVLAQAIDAGIDLIQLREKQMEVRALLGVASRALERAKGTNSRIVINDRVDAALALGAAGVHLGSHSLPALAVRAIAPPGFLVGVSCHSLEEAQTAELAGADYILFGPVYETPSKLAYGPPLGVERLAAAAARVKTPVLALGGITLERVKPCLAAGAAGIAAIRLFQDAPSLAQRVAEIRALINNQQAAEKPILSC